MFLGIPKQAWLVFGILAAFIGGMFLWAVWNVERSNANLRKERERGWDGSYLYGDPKK
jgi:hypothetical protein